jgi:uncharacterized protein (TIGR01244 family)
MTLPRAFLLALAAGALWVFLAATPPSRPIPDPPAPRPVSTAQQTTASLAPGVAVRGQISVDDVRQIAAGGYRMIINFRTDGEAAGQTSAADIERAARVAGLEFANIPTPPSTTPETSVERLATVLAAAGGPVLLTCRVGSRASRVWALAEASRSGGADAGTIAAAVRSAGHRIDDLAPEIEARIASRQPA